jgi:hypothetical protein
MKSPSLVGFCTLLVCAAMCSSLSAQSLVHLWAFDQPIGFTQNFPDTSGNDHHGVGAGDIISGKYGNAVKLLPGSNSATGGIGDGVDYIDPTPESSLLPIGAADSWTMNVWTNFAAGNDAGNLEYIAGFGIDDGEDIPTSDANARKARSIIAFPNFHFWGSNIDVDAGFAYPADDQWHMSTVTYNGATTELTMYFDGVRVKRQTFGGSGPFLDAPAEVHVGNPSNWNQEFDGSVDEFGIWNGVLSPAQVGGLFMHNNVAQPATLQPTAVVNRATGHITLGNLTASNIENLSGYEITSAAGTLNSAPWVTITGNLDQGQGANPIDSGAWTITSTTDFNLSENDLAAPRGTLDAGQTIDLGAIWTKSSLEDLVVTLKTDDGASPQSLDVIVSYTGTPYSRSDLNANGTLDLADWQLFATNGFTSLSGLSRVDSALRGDLDGDGDNDRMDFRLFRADYIAANGLAAFNALQVSIPEPSAIAMALLGVVGLACRRVRLS